MNSLQRVGIATFLLLSAVLLAGCSKDEFKTAPVRGQVTHQGQGVPGAVVVFRPVAQVGTSISGKAANGNADENGRFELSTYAIGDGAVVGKHHVSVSTDDPDKPLPGQVPEDLILEVQPGTNEFTIELVP
jgi:hypothetical protein